MNRHARITEEYRNVVVVQFAPVESVPPRPVRRRDWGSEIGFGVLLLTSLGAGLAALTSQPGRHGGTPARAARPAAFQPQAWSAATTAHAPGKTQGRLLPNT